MAYYQALLKPENHPVIIDIHEHFVKQTYRNRMRIYSANGPLDLIVPVVHAGRKMNMGEVNIDRSENWPQKHWRTLCSAYKKSAYFEYYEPLFESFYQEIPEKLIDLNQNSMNLVLKLLKRDISTSFSASYGPVLDKNDWRCQIAPNIQNLVVIEPYFQVFQERHGFVSNLSILDRLFNLGGLVGPDS